MFGARAGQVAESQLYDDEGDDEVKDCNRCVGCNVVDCEF
jgi:hypothetical protein